MQSKFFVKYVLISVCLLSLSLSACVPGQAGVVSTAVPSAPPVESLPTAMPSPDMPPLPTGMIEVLFVNDGNLQVWDEATQQTRTLVDTGDVFAVTTSDDGQVIAFTRGSWVGDVGDGYEQFSLWTMDRAGGEARELVSAQDLRQRIEPGERDSSNFYQFSWIPRSHQLIFSGTRYIAQAEGLSHALPQGAYLVDTENGSVSMLAGAAQNVRFVPSPDGKQIALMSPGGVSFVNTDGSNTQDALTFAEAGVPGPVFPTGAWTQDARAFVVTGSFEMDVLFNVNFTIWRISMDGSSPEALANVAGSHPSSVTFSPDGKHIAYLQTTDAQPAEIAGWSITALSPEAGPLALPTYGKETSYASLHWSPDGAAYAIKDQGLLPLCPDATQDSQVCGEAINLGSGIITALQWVDSARFIVEGIEPNSLSLVKVDGTITPIVTWTEMQRWIENDILSGWSFTIVR